MKTLRMRGHTSNSMSRTRPSPTLITGQMLSLAKWKVNFKALVAKKVPQYKRASQNWRRGQITLLKKMLLTRITINRIKTCLNPSLNNLHELTDHPPNASGSLWTWTNLKENSSKTGTTFCCRSTKSPPNLESRARSQAMTFVFPANWLSRTAWWSLM